MLVDNNRQNLDNRKIAEMSSWVTDINTSPQSEGLDNLTKDYHSWQLRHSNSKLYYWSRNRPTGCQTRSASSKGRTRTSRGAAPIVDAERDENMWPGHAAKLHVEAGGARKDHGDNDLQAWTCPRWQPPRWPKRSRE